MFLLFIFFLLSIVFSFLCSIWEAVLLSITPNYVDKAVREGTATGKLLENFKRDIDRPLSAILTLNTIAHTVGAIGVGAQAGNVFGDTPVNIGPVEIGGESLIAGLMTLAILVLSEIIPKTLGANYWKSLAPFTARSLQILIWVLFPLVWLSQLITKYMKKEKEKAVFSRFDIMMMAQAGEESGTLAENESAIIKNLLSFEKKTVRDIMTPKTVVVMAQEKATVGEFFKENMELRFSRIPLYGENRDDIKGLVLKDDIFQLVANDKHNTVMETIVRPANIVIENLPLPVLFESLTEKKEHLSIVVDEYGAVVGLVSMEDLFETLLGKEIVDESDEVEDMQELARKKWQEKQGE